MGCCLTGACVGFVIRIGVYVGSDRAARRVEGLYSSLGDGDSTAGVVAMAESLVALLSTLNSPEICTAGQQDPAPHFPK